MVIPKPDVPERGDAVWMDFNPQSGHQQAGRRPAIVLSPLAYNDTVGLAIVCPITNQKKGYPFEVDIPDGCQVTGVIPADQVKSLDWRARNATRAGKLPPQTVAKTLEVLDTLLCGTILAHSQHQTRSTNGGSMIASSPTRDVTSHHRRHSAEPGSPPVWCVPNLLEQCKIEMK